MAAGATAGNPRPVAGQHSSQKEDWQRHIEAGKRPGRQPAKHPGRRHQPRKKGKPPLQARTGTAQHRAKDPADAGNPPVSQIQYRCGKPDQCAAASEAPGVN